MSDLFTIDDEPLIRRNKNGKMLCKHPNCNRVVHNKGKNQGGYMDVCAFHLRGHDTIYGGYSKYKKSCCENVDGRLGFKCTTTVKDPCMLTVDHINNNHSDNSIQNLHTLCASCHNYKTKYYGHNFSTDLFEILEEFEINRLAVKDQFLFGKELFVLDKDKITW